MSQEREQSLTNQKKRKTDEMKKSRSKETKQRKRSEGVLRRDASAYCGGVLKFSENNLLFLFFPARRRKGGCVFKFIYLRNCREDNGECLERSRTFEFTVLNFLSLNPPISSFLGINYNNTPLTLH